MVNTLTTKNFNGSAEYTVEALNDSYRQGYRLDIDFVAGSKPTSTHSGPECFKLTKNRQMQRV
jgi:hypothetical protein